MRRKVPTAPHCNVGQLSGVLIRQLVLEMVFFFFDVLVFRPSVLKSLDSKKPIALVVDMMIFGCCVNSKILLHLYVCRAINKNFSFQHHHVDGVEQIC